MIKVWKDPIFMGSGGILLFGLFTLTGQSDTRQPHQVTTVRKQWVIDASGATDADAVSIDLIANRLKPGDTLLVKPGRYPTKLDVVFDLNIIGDSGGQTVLVGNDDYLIRVRSGHLRIDHLGLERLSHGVLLESSGGSVDLSRTWIHLGEGDQIKLKNTDLNVTETLISSPESTLAARVDFSDARGLFSQCGFKGVGIIQSSDFRILFLKRSRGLRFQMRLI